MRKGSGSISVIGRGYEYMDMEPSDTGAGTPGFAGTAAKAEAGPAAGLITLADDGFGGRPRMPMMPGTWSDD